MPAHLYSFQVQKQLPIHQPPTKRWLLSLLTILRLKGTAAFTLAVTALGILAGTLSAANILLPLWVYIVLYFAFYAVALLVLIYNSPRYRYAVPALLARGDVKKDDNGRPSLGLIAGLSTHAPVASVAVGRQPDPYYDQGLRSMIDGNPLIVIPANPRDVGSRDKLTLPIFSEESGNDTFLKILQEDGGSPLPMKIKRDLPGSQETEHTLAVRDLAALSHLTEAYPSRTPLAETSLAIFPEHCLDAAEAEERDLLIVGGPDSNFWHSYLFEALWQRFQGATVPLALSMRRGDDREKGHYGAYALRSRIAGLSESLGLDESASVALTERSNPTYGMVLLATNPLSEGRHWVCFLAGTRSLGTVGACWSLAAMIEQMRADPELNFGTYVETEEAGVRAGVAALLCRVTKVHYASWRDAGGKIQPGGTRRVPTDAPDLHYLDSYVPAEVEAFTLRDGKGQWEVICRS